MTAGSGGRLTGSLGQLAQQAFDSGEFALSGHGEMFYKLLAMLRLGRGDAIAYSGIGGFMSRLKLIMPAAILLGGFLLCSMATYGKPEYTKDTKKACTFCHEKNVPADKDAMNKNLTDAGKYYHEKKSLDGFVEK